MHRFITQSLVALTLLLCSVTVSFAQIKQVQMKIDGYLCGN
jgi:hypothetical protein